MSLTFTALKLATRPALRLPRIAALQYAVRFYASQFPDHTIINMPALSPTMTEGNLVKWNVKEGDQLTPGTCIAEVETDKAQMDFEFEEDGWLARILVGDASEGVPVGKPIAVYVEEEGDIAAFKDFTAADAGNGDAAPAPAAAEPAKEAAAPAAAAEPAAPAPAAAAAAAPAAAAPAATDRIVASPYAKTLALEKGLSLKGVVGTGPHGRITAKDVEALAAAPAATAAPVAGAAVAGAAPAFEDIPLTNMRKTIAKRLIASKQTAPDYFVSSDISVSKLLKLRKSLNASADGRYKLSINDLVVKAVAKACQRVPEVNSSYLEEEGVIRQFSSVDVSIAVATPTGLITPVVKSCETKGLESISAEVKVLAQKAKDNALLPEEFQGGSITISNLGMNSAVNQFTSILNPPQSAILAISTIQKRAVPDKASPFGFVFDDILTISGTFDHRVVDGKKGGDYIKALKTIIENPLEMLL
ncbi:DEKNAAC104361 [Brettanomyces naardenensis]|uniref:Acetyltransferase component of pyruvate dehydrogenase complex n=1 Tax=Brettanomyces naardenensis TaxID=13370 RepID=A0A448YQN4_BRENA|nr:DEKNAAC104361 [Brettanomyces naardenensis]